MPADRRKKTKTPEQIPDAGDPDRKRVLNVLAQRRYRQRRREKIAALEAQAKGLSPPQSSLDQSQDGDAQLEPEYPVIFPSGSLSEETEVVEDVVRQPEVSEFLEMDFGQDPLDMQLFGDFSTWNLPSPIPASPASSCGVPTHFSSSSSQPSLEFPLSPDGAQLSVPILSAIKAFMTIATALNLLNNIWDPTYLHTLPLTPALHLPPNLQPTPAQMTVPHHPLLDALPWPSVREKLICILALPSRFRPCIAQDEDIESQSQGKAIMRLVQDLDDFKEGVRVHGNMTGWGQESELVEEAWEVGECFYRNWWWCLDERVIIASNRRRRERGVGALKIK
ncbi:hypothetical protein K458DRAFT_328060 [Lentithecium fluviatile CBS 122367]|uniref:BZIP domain-containing protein n=1 Tax=Lentithecium fluviatile CBS 122367 TaxID=1168545 RepID=A0A6G1JIC3_9PLEO|nr:hypothetical protein K458DRAFT_328060 [Lentithecium fluviatile CBS 122367]